MASLPSFALPEVFESDDGWGPTAACVPPELQHLPFAPFSKSDKVGRASDWTQAAYQKFSGRYQQGQVPAVFNFFHNDEEESFHLVDNRPVKPKTFGQRRFQQNRFQPRGGRGGDRDRGLDGRGDRGKKQEMQKRQQWQNYGRDQQRTNYSSSVEIRPEWAVIEQIPFQSLVKLTCAVGEAEDVMRCGELEYYDKAYDRITVKQETPLLKTGRAFRNVSTSEDPIIRKAAAENKARVFATDNILTTLMCMKSSKYSWDLIVTKQNGKIFIDRRATSNLNFLTVNETAPDEIPEDKDNINGVQQLALEATAINQNFSQQVLAKGEERYKFEHPNPFASPDDDEELASCAYR
ncbi:eukaryotic translation initiation factor 3 subunit D [Dunaliella salina]|uniref:Eukaryotic translation initiation factor 3 subunit D n=1 Tax=Dunaliella salina TaxID=3046 RepID=A0ABQ7GST4_DUNSA|nr:eukaryotic translation initiation factor 3 subunit D [Dunaliella salina]|eukprot:KAF5837662.1 eukaryotic translation initiation factor 3 subunit D [Dunaliella salina]